MRELSHHDLLQCVRRLPAPVRDLLKARPDLMVAGGYIRACVAGEKVSDIDIMCPSKDAGGACALQLANASGGVKVHTTENALTVKLRPVPAQFITRWTFSNPTDALLSFDFSIACAAFWWDPKGGPSGGWCSMVHDDFYPDLAAKRLVYLAPVREEEAGGSMLRILKFYQRGYRIPLDSLGAVMARLFVAIDWRSVMGEKMERPETMREPEAQAAKVLTGLLREVDPNIDPDHISHLPSLPAATDPAAIEEAPAE
jgi:hypothetical protein